MILNVLFILFWLMVLALYWLDEKNQKRPATLKDLKQLEEKYFGSLHYRLTLKETIDFKGYLTKGDISSIDIRTKFAISEGVRKAKRSKALLENIRCGVSQKNEIAFIRGVSQ